VGPEVRARGGERVAGRFGQRNILLHHIILVDHLHVHLLQVPAELTKGYVRIELSAVEDPMRQCKDGRDGVGRRLVAFLIFTIMPSYRTCPTSPCVEITVLYLLTMRGFTLDYHPVRSDHTQTPETFSKDIALDVAVVVLPCPDEPAG
jgi:hypothetical protein